MATKNFTISKDALVCLLSGGTKVGAGQDDHLPVGVRYGSVIRSLLQFNLDWTNVYGITSAVLKIQTSPSNVHGIKSADTFYIARNTSSWSEGTRGSDEVWYQDNAVTWNNKPATTTTGRVSVAGSASNNVQRSYDITAIVKAWAPTSIPGGGGASNYGITMYQSSESEGHYCEFMARESSPDAYIVLTYSDTPPQTTPTITNPIPANNTLARITNMSAVTSSFSPNMEVKFTYGSGGDDQNMSKYRVKVFSDAGGTVLVYDSGDVTGPWADGTTITHAITTWHPADGTNYWWQVTVWDSYSTPASFTSSLYNFRVRWGSVIISRQIGAGATTISVALTPASPASNTQRMVLYRLADDSAGTGATPWVTATGSLPAPGANTDWMQVYIRVSSDLAGTNPSVDKATISYRTAATAKPDKWAFSPSSTPYSLDDSVRRYGSKSLKGTDLAVTSWTYPTRDRVDGDDDIPVTENTDYVLTWEVRTNDAPLSDGASLCLEVYGAGGQGFIAGAAPDSEGGTIGTFDADGNPLYPEGWKRLRLQFKTPMGCERVRPFLRYGAGAAADTFWQDGAALTEGKVAPPWAQGTVAASGSVSSTGMVMDGAGGAIFRLRGSAGGTGDVVELGDHGLVFGGDATLYRSGTDKLATDDTFNAVAGVQAGGNDLTYFVPHAQVQVFANSNMAPGSAYTNECSSCASGKTKAQRLYAKATSSGTAAHASMGDYAGVKVAGCDINVAGEGMEMSGLCVSGGTNGRQSQVWSDGTGNVNLTVWCTGGWRVP